MRKLKIRIGNHEVIGGDCGGEREGVEESAEFVVKRKEKKRVDREWGRE